ncbi:elongation factor 1-alpha, partial [archaeon]
MLDAPGHRDYIPNMIRGATQGDAALLVVPASPGEFESATGPGAQTREHAVLLRALGVQQVVVVVNKMDCTVPAWSSARFHQVSEALIALLVGELQFREEQVRCLPVSGLSG